MIHPDTRVTWLNTAAGKHQEQTIEMLFIEYADRVQRISQNCRAIALGIDSPLMIQDWQGWTTVLAIKCFENQEPNWINLFSRPQPHIGVVVSKFELIPFYTPGTLRSGFHGSVKFRYMLKHSEKIVPEDRIRLRGDLEGGLPEFHQPGWAHHHDPVTHGYEIITASNFYNANGIHLYGNDEIPIEAIEECGWK